MQARPYGQSVHSRGKPNQISPARRQAILSNVPHSAAKVIGNAANKLSTTEQDVESVNPDIESNS
jgi:hypothetical protein